MRKDGYKNPSYFTAFVTPSSNGGGKGKKGNGVVKHTTRATASSGSSSRRKKPDPDIRTYDVTKRGRQNVRKSKKSKGSPTGSGNMAKRFREMQRRAAGLS